jgi:hypothetical protein
MTRAASLAAALLAVAPLAPRAADAGAPPASAPPGGDAAAPAAPAAPATPYAGAPAKGPDLELHVPRAEVAKVSLDVENLQAKLDLDTKVANLVQITAGVVATVQKMKLELEGVSAETHLVVRLDRVAKVMERALGTIDHGPGIAGASDVRPTVSPVPAAATAPAPRPPDASVSPAASQPAQH